MLDSIQEEEEMEENVRELLRHLGFNYVTQMDKISISDFPSALGVWCSKIDKSLGGKRIVAFWDTGGALWVAMHGGPGWEKEFLAQVGRLAPGGKEDFFVPFLGEMSIQVLEEQARKPDFRPPLVM